MGNVQVSVYGSLRMFMDREGGRYHMERDLGPQGITAFDLASELGLPVDKVEAVFCNGRIINIYDRVCPGDRVAFFPFGTPGPYRVFLGMIRENIRRQQMEQDLRSAPKET
ncbi:MAG: MoaD/ThiS family protein [Deltaproteobacteria bacterium]|nr:MoaD/ThiS family protein [Deltaproteobacteria bacterium]MBW1929780.1 MoaD/ThiS family protein [Deltaproteobacteria bacterium]MBW2024427.1 MoaD/ThiS family protein [Deltaproteobacteria bacterium]MBW2124528.1 MoaD/ThiS family protein [Deltaproteobacteria bacterium]RLB24361.1 MAG: MoaD/ThiS family protein [Deltaproteobacteria bacterium]